MKYVLDSSIAVKWVLPEIHSDKALRLRDDFQKSIHELLAPDVFPGEVGHQGNRIKVDVARIPWPESLATTMAGTPNSLRPTLDRWRLTCVGWRLAPHLAVFPHLAHGSPFYHRVTPHGQRTF